MGVWFEPGVGEAILNRREAIRADRSHVRDREASTGHTSQLSIQDPVSITFPSPSSASNTINFHFVIAFKKSFKNG